MIVHVAQELRYGTFFNSVEPADLILQPIYVANTWIVQSLFSDERTRKTTSVATSIPSKFLKFASRCLEVVWHIELNEHIESVRAFSVCYKTFWFAKGGY